ncbi:MAG: hypothetical protein KJ725_01920 [Gammaproteobacteria bacterium]|nr:hypothetical protein [Gammaproteobacteria bacterium]
MVVYRQKQSGIRSLKHRIRDAEAQLLNRQRKVDTRAAALVRNIHQQITAPATLLLAGGIGFIIGELTKRQNSKYRGTTDKPVAIETSPLNTALSLMTSMRTLYTTLLSLAWIIKSYHQPGETKPRARNIHCKFE